MRRRVAIASRSACSFVWSRVTVRRGSLVARALAVLVLAVPWSSDSAALAGEGACACARSGGSPAAGGSASTRGDIVAGDSDEAAVDGRAIALGDVDSPAVANDSDDPAGDGSEPSVCDSVAASAVRGAAAGALDAGSGAVVGAPPVMVRGSGGCVGVTDIQ